MTRWIDTADALIAILKYGPDVANEYQIYLDDSYLDDEEDWPFEEWLANYIDGLNWINGTHELDGHRLDATRYGLLK